MPNFRNLPHHRHSGRAHRSISDMYNGDRRRVGTPYDRPAKRESIEPSIPLIASPSSSEPATQSPVTAPLDAAIYTIASSSPETKSVSDAFSPIKSLAARNKKSHGRRREAGYVPRPRNSFIVFRSWWIDRQKDSGEGQQNELSKLAGKAWRKMSGAEKQSFKEIAAREQQIHKEQHPNYQYTPGPRRSISVSRAKSSKTAQRKTSGSLGGSRKRKAAEEVWATSSATSSEPESPEFIPPTTRVPRAPRAAAQIAAQRLEQMATSPASPASPTQTLQTPLKSPRLSPTGDEIAPQHSPSVDEEEAFVPTDEIPPLELDPHHRTEGSKEGEPSYVSDCPPSMSYDAEAFGLYRNPVDTYPPLPLVPASALDPNFDHSGWQFMSRPSSPLEVQVVYPFPLPFQSPGSSSSEMADISTHRVDENSMNFDIGSWIRMSPEPEMEGIA